LFLHLNKDYSLSFIYQLYSYW